MTDIASGEDAAYIFSTFFPRHPGLAGMLRDRYAGWLTKEEITKICEIFTPNAPLAFSEIFNGTQVRGKKKIH